jgi:hypothetical protein
VRGHWEAGWRCGWSVVIILVIILLQIWVFKATGLVPGPSKVGSSRVGVCRGTGGVILPLAFESNHPLLKCLLIQELDGEILNTRVSLPPDLHTVIA